jgi:type II secretory pathway component PulM
VVEASIRSSALADAVAGVSAVADERVQVTLRPVAFDALVTWLGDLGSREGIAVDTLRVTATTAPGKVQVDALVLRGVRNP